MNDEKEVLGHALDSLNDALNYFSDLEDDEAHADIYWEIKDASESLMKRIKEIAE